MSSPKRILITALTLSALGLVSTSHSARADDTLDTLSQTLELPGGVISEIPQSPVSLPGLPGGVISEIPQSPVSLPGLPGGIISEIPQSPVSLPGLPGGIISEIPQWPLGNIRDILGQIFRPFEQLMQRYLGAAGDFLNRAPGDFIGSNFAQQEGDRSGSGLVNVDVPPGRMGIPDFYKVGKALQEKVMSGDSSDPVVEAQNTDRFNLNPVVLSHSLTSEQNRTISKTLAASVLSDAGQQAMADEGAAAAQTLQLIQSKAIEAQDKDVTQDVMKDMAAMMAGQASLDSGNYAHTMLIHQQLAANGVVATNISEALDEANRSRHAEAMAGATVLLRTAASAYMPGGVLELEECWSTIEDDCKITPTSP